MIQTKKYNCIFLDRDGTLNPDPGYISSIRSFGFYDFTLDALRKISSKKNVFCIISNQSGVGRGLIKKEDLEEINDFIKTEFKSHSINLLDIYCCMDHPKSATERRKPGLGMFLEAKKEHKLTLNIRDELNGNSFEVGKRLSQAVFFKKKRVFAKDEFYIFFPKLKLKWPRSDGIASELRTQLDHSFFWNNGAIAHGEQSQKCRVGFS